MDLDQAERASENTHSDSCSPLVCALGGRDDGDSGTGGEGHGKIVTYRLGRPFRCAHKGAVALLHVRRSG